MSDAELRAEAERLSLLDQKGLEQELLYRTLRIGRDSEKAMDGLHSMDLKYLDEMLNEEEESE